MHSRRALLGFGAAALAAVAMSAIPATASAPVERTIFGTPFKAYMMGPGTGWQWVELTEPTEMAAHVRLAFVDNSVFPGCEQLRVFYRDKVYAPKHAAMQPDSGAGTVLGDRAQSVGKAGDLKAGRLGGVQSGAPAAPGAGTPGAKSVDALKQSWLRRMLWPMSRTRPA